MNTTPVRPARHLALVLAGVAFGFALPAFAACDVHSGARTAALVELYTSEGCSSCPPADRQLVRLKEALDPDASAVPLSLHVDYWDEIGWKDPFAQGRFDQRQAGLVRLGGHQTVYTPQFFVAGREVRNWPAGLADAVRQVNARRAVADLRIEAHPTAAGSLAVRVTAAAPGDGAALYVSITESRLVSKVARGENGGVTLHHDHVARLFFGPVALIGGRSDFIRELALPGLNAQNVDVAAFVADERSGNVLQALAATACTGP